MGPGRFKFMLVMGTRHLKKAIRLIVTKTHRHKKLEKYVHCPSLRVAVRSSRPSSRRGRGLRPAARKADFESGQRAIRARDPPTGRRSESRSRTTYKQRGQKQSGLTREPSGPAPRPDQRRMRRPPAVGAD